MSLSVSQIAYIADVSRWQCELLCFQNLSRAFFPFEQPKYPPFCMLALSCLFSLEKHMLHTTRHLFQDHNATMKRIYTNMG